MIKYSRCKGNQVEKWRVRDIAGPPLAPDACKFHVFVTPRPLGCMPLDVLRTTPTFWIATDMDQPPHLPWVGQDVSSAAQITTAGLAHHNDWHVLQQIILAGDLDLQCIFHRPLLEVHGMDHIKDEGDHSE